MKRHNIELMIGWLDALRRRDTEALLERLDPQTTWQGIRPDLVCQGSEIVEIFVAQRDQDYHVDALELIGAPDHAILHFGCPNRARSATSKSKTGCTTCSASRDPRSRESRTTSTAPKHSARLA